MKKLNSSQEIEAVLNSLDHAEKIEAPLFFHARLMAELEKRKTHSYPDKLIQLLSHPLISVSALSIFLVLNIFTISSLISQHKHAGAGKTELQSFAIEYNLNTTTVYSTNPAE